MARGKRGGKRRPTTPAAVSGPGALSQRTDGGPGALPPDVAGGQPYGERQVTEAIADAAPMYDREKQGATPQPVNQGPMPDAGGPTQRPTLPSGNGVTGTQASVTPADQVLRAVYAAYPSPWIRSLLDANPG